MKWKYRKVSGDTNRHASSATRNLFAELEYIENLKADAEDVAQVHNLVGTSRILSQLHKLDLRAISNLMPNSKFEKQKFAAITIRLGQPVCTVLLFTSGKMVLTGCKSMLDCILASTSVFYHMRASLAPTAQLLATAPCTRDSIRRCNAGCKTTTAVVS